MTGDLVLLTTPAMRARRHPWAVVGLWAWQTALALVVGWSASSVARGAFESHPRGDAVLWDPGAHALMDFSTRDAHGLRAVTGAAAMVALVAAVAGLVPTAAAMVSIAYATRNATRAGLARSLAAAVGALRALLVALVVTTVAQALMAVVGALAFDLVEAWLRGSLGEARAQQIAAVVLLVFLAVVSAIGVVHDLARAAIVRFKVKGMRAIALGARTFRLAPLSLWWSWAWRAGASLAPIAAGVAVASRAGGRGGLALLLLFVVHQAIVVARVALRASWLAKALRSVDGSLRPAAQPEASDR